MVTTGCNFYAIMISWIFIESGWRKVSHFNFRRQKLNKKLNIVEIQTSQIVPYENNPRDNEKAVDYVMESITNFGFRVPIIIDKNNVIVCGHTRYKAALRLNMELIPCIIVTDLTQEQIKAFRIADNKVAEKSKWNELLLKDELQALQTLNFDIASIGFDNWEIEQMLEPVTLEGLEELFIDKSTTQQQKKENHLSFL